MREQGLTGKEKETERKERLGHMYEKEEREKESDKDRVIERIDEIKKNENLEREREREREREEGDNMSWIKMERERK